MDLSLEFGIPAEALSRSMTEREFRAWGNYALRRALPVQRLEYYLAQIAYLIAVTMGGAKNARLSDFIMQINEPEKEMDELESVKQAFNFAPRFKKNG